MLAVSPGQIVININANGYLPRTDTMLILGDREQFATISLQSIKYGTIAGTIYDAATGKPISGAIFYRGPVYGEEQTDPLIGTFALRNIPDGRYILTARGPENYLAQTCTLELQGGKLLRRDFYLRNRSQTNQNNPNEDVHRP